MTGARRPWGRWHRPQGGWFIYDDDAGTVLGYVAGGDSVADGWVIYPTWVGGHEPVVGPHRNVSSAAQALYELWLADPDRNAPEVPAP